MAFPTFTPIHTLITAITIGSMTDAPISITYWIASEIAFSIFFLLLYSPCSTFRIAASVFTIPTPDIKGMPVITGIP